jgi:hypothetical protein
MNDLSHFLLVTLCLFGGLSALLFILTLIDPQTDRTGLRHSRASSRYPRAAPSRGRRLG